MNNSDYRFTLDVQLHQAQVSVPVSLGDSARRLCIGLTDGRKPYVIEEGCRVTFNAKKPDGTTIKNDCIIERNTIIYDFTEQTTNVKGVVKCDVTIYGIDGRILTSPQFILVVDENAVNYNEIAVSVSESTTIQNIIASEQARVEAEERREEIADFLANSGGVIVSEEEPSESLANVWIKPNPEGTMYLLDSTDIVQKLSDDTDKIPSVKLVKTALVDAVEDAIVEAKNRGDFKGDKGDSYILTDADKSEIAQLVLSECVDGDSIEYTGDEVVEDG